MKVTKLHKDVFLYQVINEETKFSGNMIAIFDEDEFVLIDAGYKSYMKELMNTLDFSKCKAVMFTHHHPDHSFGVKLLEDIELIGHKDYIKSYEEVITTFNITEWSIDGTHPTRFMEDKEKYTFGKHVFTFYHHPLHTASSMLIDLDNKILFTGDELLNDIEGNFITNLYFMNPNMWKGGYSLVKDLAIGKTVVPGHGAILEDGANDIIEKSEKYLTLVQQGIPFDELERHGIKCDYYEEFHEINLSHSKDE